MNQLFTIAQELSNISRRRFELKQHLSEVEAHQAARETALIPETGVWPGTNDAQRKASEKITKAADAQLVEYAEIIHDLNYDLGKLDVDRECLIAERDAWQWTIRDNEVSCTGLRSAFVEYEVWLKGKAALETAKVETPASIATLDERARDDAAAYIRLNEITDLDAACMWELPEHLITGSAMDARARNQELQELQDAYEQKYHL